MDLNSISPDVLDIILKQLLENNAKLTDLRLINKNFKNIVDFFINNIKSMSLDKIYQMFKAKNPLIFYIPMYRCDVNYFKALTYLYNKDNNYADLNLFIKISDNYSYLKTISNAILLNSEYPNLDYPYTDTNKIKPYSDYKLNYKELLYIFIINTDDIELYNYYNILINKYFLTMLIQSQAVNIMQYIINNNFDLLISIMDGDDFSDGKSLVIYNSKILLSLLQIYDLSILSEILSNNELLLTPVDLIDDDGLYNILSSNVIANINLFLQSVFFNGFTFLKFINLPKSYNYIINNYTFNNDEITLLQEEYGKDKKYSSMLELLNNKYNK